jgi:hypothetical protein
VGSEQDNEQREVYVVYTFTISRGKTTTQAEVILPEEELAMIKQREKDPKTAAWMSLERVLKEGRDPFETPIILRIPFGHAEHFSKHGNYQSLPTLAG